MGSSGDPQYNAIDPTVGGLVWVRRRNGSWWPGQIIAADEYSEGFKSSPKSGTPIKLLGRDDPIVDWYNLEKSKRVKPFRCGEYKACINKAKKAATNPAKKTVKYARREDAIICALAIEMENNLYVDHTDDELSGFEGDTSSAHDLTEDPNQARLRQTTNDSEDEGVKRMRGLDDLGMVTVPAMKRKRTLVPHVQEFLKKKSRRRPLAKVLESTSMVTNKPHQGSPVVINKEGSIDIPYASRNLGDDSESGLVGCKPKEIRISSVSAIHERAASENLIEVPLMAKRMQGNEELHESASTSSGAADMEETGNSNWQSKGKRNSRTSIRTRKPDLGRTSNMDDDFDDTLDEYWGWSGRGSQKAAPLSGHTALLHPQRTVPYRQSRFNMNPRYGPDFSTTSHNDYYSDLFEVNLEVKASSGGQHVPFTSLMSKSTGQPVVGYPITVEVLKEGSTNDLCKPKNGAKRDLSSSGSERNMFVPEYERKIAPKHLKSHRVSPIKSTRLGKTTPSSKKIRKLSSIKGFGKLSEGVRSLVAENIMGSVGCIPLKAVYSRVKVDMRISMRPPRRVANLRKW